MFIFQACLTQVSDLKITVLSTIVADYDYIGEWGFSALVESDKKGFYLILVLGQKRC